MTTLDWDEEDPAREAADAFLLFTSGLTLDQMARTVDFIAADLEPFPLK